MNENNRFKDFDAFFAEQNRENVKFKMFGEEHILPPALPAKLVLKLIRLSDEHNATSEIPQKDLAELCLAVVGEKTFEELCDKGMDIEQMSVLLEWVMQAYNLQSGKKAKNPKGSRRKTQ